MAPSLRFDQNYYEMLMRDYGYDPLKFGRINFTLGTLEEDELQAKWLCHHDGDVFSQKLGKGEKSAVSTGFGMSGVPHIGTISQIFRSVTLQRAGVPVSMVIGDLDAYNNKETPLKETEELSSRFREFVLKLGFKDVRPSILRRQYNEPEVLRTAYLIGRFMEDEMFDQAEEDLYGSYRRPDTSCDVKMPYRRKLSLNLMTADFIDTHYREGITNLMVMLGVDEHRFVRLARKIVEKMGDSEEFRKFEMSISGLYTPLIIGFNNHPKMSKSVSNSGITVCTRSEEIKSLVLHGEGQYDKPEDNVVYQMLLTASYMTRDDIANAYYECLNRTSKWERIKSDYADMLIDLCSKW
jgi:tryptophanyl-tRNA synthetase